MEIVTEKLNNDPKAIESLQFLLAQNYLEMGKTIGSSESSKVVFMDPRSLLSTIEGMRSVLSESSEIKTNSDVPNNMDIDLEAIKQRYSE